MSVRLRSAWIGLLVLAGGCSLAPRYEVPDVPVPERYGGEGSWQSASPGDALPRGPWWSRYADPRLDELEAALERDSPDLATAVARYGEARALAAEAGAGLFPVVVAGGYANSDRQSDNRPLRSATQPATYRDNLLGGAASYELDLWGRARNVAAAGRAAAQASAGDLASLRLGLQAELAADYLTLCGLDAQLKLYDDTITAYTRALDLVRDRYQGGIASGLDLARAENQLATAQAQRTDYLARRELLLHAIARLVGRAPDQVPLPPRPELPAVPDIPLGVPSTLVERRPDVAAAERRMASANADIGVARAAYFPRITLGATGGFESTSAGGWLTAPNRFWAVGPQALLTLFDAGLRRAEVERTRAVFDEAAARYRGTVLSAFQEVADNLTLLGRLGTESEQQTLAARAAERSLALATSRYTEGAASYLEVVTAQTSALQAEGALVALDVRRLTASVGLVRGLGGGWTRAELPNGR
ncbi:MAG: efflux transporter outer membrane subunit [Proteobacteria bacterium]|nr:efflux transporter outer membrane subunit [Pseudomonadota bacterium]